MRDWVSGVRCRVGRVGGNSVPQPLDVHQGQPHLAESDLALGVAVVVVVVT